MGKLEGKVNPFLLLVNPAIYWSTALGPVFPPQNDVDCLAGHGDARPCPTAREKMLVTRIMLVDISAAFL